MSKALSIDLIHMKTKTNRIEQIKSLNLWGNDLEDVSIVQKMTSLEVLSLAVNHISTLQDFRYCTNLRELYLRQNKISSLAQLQHLQGLRKLKVLSLSENPISSHPKYRKAILHVLPSLEKLDNTPVGSDEVDQAQGIDIMELEQELEPAPRMGQQPQKQSRPQQDYYDEPDQRGNYQQHSEEEQDDTYAFGKGRGIQRSPPNKGHPNIEEQIIMNEQQEVMRKVESPQSRGQMMPNQMGMPPGMYQQMQANPPMMHPQMNPNSTNFYGIPNYQQESHLGYQDQEQEYQSKRIDLMRQQTDPGQYQMAYQRREEGERVKKKWGPKEGDNDSFEKRKKQKIQFRNENILCAIIALMKELDKGGLEFVKKDCEKRIKNWKEEDEYE